MGHMVERAHSLWHWGDAQDEDRQLPLVLDQLVQEMITALRHLAGNDLGEDVTRLVKEAESSLSTASGAYRRQWMSREHRQHLRSIDEADGILSPAAEETQSPLATDEWINYRRSLQAVFAALPEGLSVWPELAGLMAQVLSLGDAEKEQAQILGKQFPIPALRDMLRTARDTHPSLSDLDVELADPGTDVCGYVDLGHVQRKVMAIRKAILDRLASGNAPEAPPETKKRKGRGRWPITRTEPEVAHYLSEHAGLYEELVPLVLQGDAEGFKKFKAHFGATAIARAITNKAGGGEEGSCGKSHVQKTAAYRQCVRPLLKTPPDRPKGWQSQEEKAGLRDYLRDI